MARKYAIEAFPSLQVPIPCSFSGQIDRRGNSKMNRLEDYTTEMEAVVEEARGVGRRRIDRPLRDGSGRRRSDWRAQLLAAAPPQ